MPEAMIAAINAKLDMILERLDRMDNEHLRCRAHCDNEMPNVHHRIDKLKERVDQIIGSKINPTWIYAASMLVMAIIALVGFGLGIKHQVGH